MILLLRAAAGEGAGWSAGQQRAAALLDARGGRAARGGRHGRVGEPVALAVVVEVGLEERERKRGRGQEREEENERKRESEKEKEKEKESEKEKEKEKEKERERESVRARACVQLFLSSSLRRKAIRAYAVSSGEAIRMRAAPYRSIDHPSPRRAS